jgi:cbb3-type cytochrome oxidase subunit 3
MASAYIFIGSYFHDFFESYYTILLVIFAITAIWFVYEWLKKMKTKNE